MKQLSGGRGAAHTWAIWTPRTDTSDLDMHDDKRYPPADYPRGPGSHMSAPRPPSAIGGQTVVTMNTDPTPGASVTEINLDLGYFKTLPGILKLIQLVRIKLTALLPTVANLLIYTVTSGEKIGKEVETSTLKFNVSSFIVQKVKGSAS
jgi:hypothetical protein